MSKCRYCRRWQEVNPNLLFTTKDTTDRVISERFCPKTNKRMVAEDPSCLEIKVSKTFYCYVLEEQVHTVACLSRQGAISKKAKYPPYKCGRKSQCMEVRQLTRGRNILLELGYIKPAPATTIPLRNRSSQ